MMQAFLRNEKYVCIAIIFLMVALLISYILLQPFQTIGISMVVAIVVSVCSTLFFGLSLIHI